jgi:hypothetical protein
LKDRENLEVVMIMQYKNASAKMSYELRGLIHVGQNNGQWRSHIKTAISLRFL